MHLEQIIQLKNILDKIRPLNEKVLSNLDEWMSVELTYSSNAIEGNTLTRKETALILEKGLTISGKPLKDHLEATNHKDALSYVKSLIDKRGVDENDILKIHTFILSSIDHIYAGVYRDIPVRISGSPVILPNYAKVPHLMKALIESITNTQDNPVICAIKAHYDFVSIHPFVDGNGRTGRLLMNMILMQNGYPPAIISPKDRIFYLKYLEKAQLGGDISDYYHFMQKAVLKSLKIYINAIEGKPTKMITSEEELLKIGELSKKTQETVPTLRHWIKIGLIQVTRTTPSGYQLFDMQQIDNCKKIRSLQEQRFTLEEILNQLHAVD
ncbi:MAG: Fic family protein [Sphingobacteriaceae bacterium]|nr:Fic family protein [Sphingobacteriaceae bacterium]